MKADQFPLLLHVALCGLGLEGMREMSLLRAEMLGIRFGDLIRGQGERKEEKRLIYDSDVRRWRNVKNVYSLRDAFVIDVSRALQHATNHHQDYPNNS